MVIVWLEPHLSVFRNKGYSYDSKNFICILFISRTETNVLTKQLYQNTSVIKLYFNDKFQRFRSQMSVKNVFQKDYIGSHLLSSNLFQSWFIKILNVFCKNECQLLVDSLYWIGLDFEGIIHDFLLTSKQWLILTSECDILASRLWHLSLLIKILLLFTL